MSRELLTKECRLFPTSAGGDIRTVLCYPNTYWVAMSNLGFQTVLKILSAKKRLVVDRAYLDDTINEEKSIKSFENKWLLSRIELLLISVSFETDYLGVLKIIQNAGISLDEHLEINPQPKEQQEKFLPPLIIGGGTALSLNPEPLANFFDAILIGEAEETLPQMIDVFLESRDRKQDRETLLPRLSEIPGIYVPSLLKVFYGKDHKIAKLVSKNKPYTPVKKCFIRDLNDFATTTAIQTTETEFKSMFMTETGRGCEIGCRFCVSGYMSRPTRRRRLEVIADSFQVGLKCADCIGFVGAAVSSHPDISKLGHLVASKGKRAAISSIMTQKVTLELARSLNESKYHSIALAPETGSEELRFRLGKRVINEQLIYAVRTLCIAGIRNIKLYFMVGLPAEKEEDATKIAELAILLQQEALEACRSLGDNKVAPTISISVNPFIPKAWTPFQRHPFSRFEEIRRKVEMIRDIVRLAPNVKMKHESPREAYFQVLMSRGDRRVGDILVYLYSSEKDWRRIYRLGSKNLIDGVPPLDFYVYREFDKNEIFPWDVVDLGVKKPLLEREYFRALNEDVRLQIKRAKKEWKLKLESKKV